MSEPRRGRWRSSPAIQERARQLRRALTPAEQRLWRRLRGGQIDGFEFRRQYPMGRFIVDFYCPSSSLIVEVDGDTHAERAEYDEARTQWIESEHHCRVIRFTNEEIDRNLDAVLGAIAAAVKRPPP
jgi:very-short-patch-repair endonuclease